MNILQREITFESCVKGENIFVRIAEPEERRDIKGVVQIAHGMAEHSLLYTDFMKFLASQGYFVAANDHLGHGKTLSPGGVSGYFGPGGVENLIRDMHHLYELIHAQYGNVPYYLLGHSMGSFLARSYTARYGKELDGAIYIGTCGSTGGVVYAAELLLADFLVRKKGPKGHDPIFAKLSTQRYNQAFQPVRTPNDWISRDREQVDFYTNDPLCGFDMTVSGYRDIVALQKEIGSQAWYRAVPDIPLLILSGDQDPVGGFGKGVRQVAKRLKKTGHNVKLVLYLNARHAILTETNKDEVYQEVLNFLHSCGQREKTAV